MRTQDTQGSFITLIRTFLAKAQEVSEGVSVADPSNVATNPRAEVVANLLVLRALPVRLQERLGDEDQPGEKVFRYSSSKPCATSDASSLRVGLKLTHASALRAVSDGAAH